MLSWKVNLCVVEDGRVFHQVQCILVVCGDKDVEIEDLVGYYFFFGFGFPIFDSAQRSKMIEPPTKTASVAKTTSVRKMKLTK